MAIVAAELIARVAVQGAKEAEAQLTGVGGAAEKAGGLMKIALVAGAVAVGVALYESVKAAAEFQQNLLKLYTTAGEAKSALGMVGQGILDMSVQVGIGANELLKGMYWVESAGFHGAAGLNVLRIAAEGAKTENSDLAGVAHALTGVLNTYASTNITAAQAMNVLIASVGQGATTLNDMSAAISNVLPAGSKFHLQLIDLTTAIATMTNQNDNAASAATHLRQVILALESPAKAGAKALAEIGLSADQLHKAMSESLPGAIQTIIDLLGKKFPAGSAAYNDALKAIAGGNKQLMGMLELSGTSLDKWKQAVATVTAQVKAGGSAVMGWADVQQNFNFKIDQAKAAVEKLAIQVGTYLLPFLSQLLTAVLPVITSFGDWWTNSDNLAGVLNTLEYYLAPLISAIQDTWTYLQPLLAGLVAWAIRNNVLGIALAAVKLYVQLLAAEIRFMVPVIVSVITAVIAFVASLWGALGPGILQMVAFIRTNWTQIAGIFQGIWGIIVGIVKVAWGVVSGIILVGLDILNGKWSKAWQDLHDACQTIMDGIVSYLRGAMRLVLSVLALLPGAIGDAAKAGIKWLDSLNTAAKQSTLDMQKSVVANLQAMVSGIQTQLDNATSASQRHFLEMKLDAAKQSLAMQQSVLQNMQGTSDGVNKILGTMATVSYKNADQLRANVINRLTALNDEAIGHSVIPDMIKKIDAAFTKMAADATTWGTNMINNFLAGLQSAWKAVVSWVTTVLAWLFAQFSNATSAPSGAKAGQGNAPGTNAVSTAVGNIVSSVRGPVPSFASGLGMSGPPIINVNVAVSPQMSVDGRALTQALGPYLAKEIQIQTGYRKP